MEPSESPPTGPMIDAVMSPVTSGDDEGTPAFSHTLGGSEQYYSDTSGHSRVRKFVNFKCRFLTGTYDGLAISNAPHPPDG